MEVRQLQAQGSDRNSWFGICWKAKKKRDSILQVESILLLLTLVPSETSTVDGMRCLKTLTLVGASLGNRRDTIGEAWALSLSPDGKVLNTTTHDGRVILWDASSLKKTAEIDMKGSFGTSIACVEILAVTN